MTSQMLQELVFLKSRFTSDRIASMQMKSNYRREKFGVLAGIAALSLGLLGLIAGSAVQAKNPPPIPNVSSTVFDFTDSTNTVQNLLRSDDYNATGQASYATEGNVLSQINGFWYLNLLSQTTRTVYLTFSQTVSGPNSPLPDGYYDAELISRCFDTNINIIDFLSVSLSDNRCSMRVNLTHRGASYVFVMSPESEYAGTGWATVVCNATSSGDCVSWTITPTPGANATVAKLYSVNPRNSKETLIGSYTNTYRIEVANP